MATLRTQTVTRAGLAPTFDAAAGGGDRFTPSKDTVLHIRNGGGAPITATVVTPKEAFPGAAIADIAIVVPAGGLLIAGPFAASDFRDPVDGLATLTYSSATSVTVAVLEVAER